MPASYPADPYREACRLLPEALESAALSVPERHMARAEELRLRTGQPLSLTLPEAELPLSGTTVLQEDLEFVLDRASEFSRYTASETLRQGFLTAPGGFRIGVCGTALPSGGDNTGFRELSSLTVRIPRIVKGVALPILPSLVEHGAPVSALILSPPGGGKTTLLRDLVRLFSQGSEYCAPVRVSLVDERGELAAVVRGRPQVEVGPRTDVLTGCPKHLAVPILLRSMNPPLIARDELAVPADVEAVHLAWGCGAALLSTVHAASLRELAERRPLAGLLAGGPFRRAVLVSGKGADRQYRVEELP